MSAGPSQKKHLKPDAFPEVHLTFKTPAEIDKALTSQGNVDQVIRVLSSLQSQFQHPGAQQSLLKQWFQSTSAEALLTLWDYLEGEGAYGKVLSMLISLLTTILRHSSSSSESDKRLARSLLSAPRVAQLNAYLAGKSASKNGSSSQNAVLVAETLNLLAALTVWDPKTVLESIRWDIDAISRILRSNRRKDGKGKGREKTHRYTESRSRAALLSLITCMLGQDVPARVKSAFLALGTPTLTLLQTILSGLGDSYEGNEYVFSYGQIRNLLETIYAGIWCDKRIPRNTKVAIFAFGQASNVGKDESAWRGRVAGDKLWKGLLAVYVRTEPESFRSDNSEENMVQDDDGIPADLVHHFLLAICTRPGQGVCFRDKGWYPSNHSDKISYDDVVDLGATHSNVPYADEDSQSNHHKFNIHNPLLLRVLRLLSPSADPRQQELAARILEACPELVASCGEIVSGGSGALDPRLNARWIVAMAWYGRVVALPVPEDMFYLPQSDSGGVRERTPRVTPPPLRSVVESVVPSFTGGGTKTSLTKALSAGGGIEKPTSVQDSKTGSGLGLVQHTTALTLCRCLEKYTQVRSALLRAARAAGEEEQRIEEANVGGGKSTGSWTRRLAEVTREVRARVPDVQVILAFLKRIEAASSELESSSNSSKTLNSTALALLSESAHRLVWLYHACFASMSEEGLGNFDAGGLVASLTLFSAKEPKGSDEDVEGDAATELDGLKTMKDVHILRTLYLGANGDFASRVFTKAGTHKHTYLHILLRAFARGSLPQPGKKSGHAVLQDEIHRLLVQVLSNSILFRRDDNRYRGGSRDEVRIWLAALAESKDVSDADAIVAFLDECAQRYMRTPERYLDALDQIREANMSTFEERTYGGLSSPFLVTLLEQLEYKLLASSTQRHSALETVISSLSHVLALVSFMRGLFVRLVACCEPRALPVLKALAEKICINEVKEDNGTIQAEAMDLRTMLRFTHLYHFRDSTTKEYGETFETLYVTSTVARLGDPSWHSTLVEKMFMDANDAEKSTLSNTLRVVRLISHSIAAATSSQPDVNLSSSIINSLLILLTLVMVKSSEIQTMSLLERQLLKEYVFAENEVLQELWLDTKRSSVHGAIGVLLQGSFLNPGDPADRTILGNITEHWVAYLRRELQTVKNLPTKDTQLTLALVWLQYAHPLVLCELFDTAYACRSEAKSTTTATVVIMATLDSLKVHARIAFDGGSDIVSDSDSLAIAAQLRSRFSIFLSLSLEQSNSRVQSLDHQTLDELILYTLQSRLPIGYNGILSRFSCEPHTSFHHRRRQWQQRLEDRLSLPHSDVIVQHYLYRGDHKAWTSTTVHIVCNAIYSGFIEPAAVNIWLAHLAKGELSDGSLFSVSLVPILHAHLDYIRAHGGILEDQQDGFWNAYEAPLHLISELAFSNVPTLSTENQIASGECLNMLLELADADISDHGQKLVGMLVKQVKTLSPDRMTWQLLIVGKTAVLGRDQGLLSLGEAVVDHALQWVVRMLTGCREIGEEDTRLLSELINVLTATNILKSHFAEPVVTAVVREHPYSELALRLLATILPKAQLKPLIVNRHIQTLVQHPHFANFTTSSTKNALTNVLYVLFHLHPVNTCQPSHVQPLISLYGGSASVADRKLLAIFRLFEAQRRTSIASLFAQWSSSPQSFQSTSALEALKDVDSLLVLRTALHFPQWRVLDDANTDNDWEEWPEASDIYDPVFLLLLFAHVLAEDVPKTIPSWVELFRTNAVGLVIRALSSKDDLIRELAAAQIAVLWKALEHAEMLETPHVFHILSLLRDVLHPAHGHAPERLPSYTTLLLAHALRGVFYPSNFTYPITARFLLQRSTLDIGDVPMLYGMLYSSAEDHGKRDRAWIIRMLADGMQSSADWRVFKSRHTWDLLASLFQSEEKERSLKRGVLEVLANLTCIPQAAMSLLLKSSLLIWIEMQLIVTLVEDEGPAWLKVLENILIVADSVKLEVSTGGEWRACIARCLLLLINACKCLHTFPVFRLLTGIVLRLALLPGTPVSQMPRLLNRCMLVFKDQETKLVFPDIARAVTDSESPFKAPHGAFNLWEIPPLSDAALCKAQEESIEQLWQVTMLLDADRKSIAWDELTSLLLVWRACTGERSVVGEWTRREVLRNVNIKK
ncbi:ribosome 60S biogenesis N-terminal-domain-containing protein [Rhodocollybia butyracea]|uniref:Ribosome 60S biogenesis N-terminal-domain-containing protein n=1 Tax=Rhodocollybia butyracea TaxID=206335 RepID=A0A9P5PM56_9AGAR|nr:ribosome 60S biogenesis N-terminal-domain-containing protein [Rhodocollybia butyracea]